MTNLRYAVHVTPLEPVAGDLLVPPDGAPALWSPISSTLIYGPTEAVLVDAPVTAAQGEALADWVAGFDRRLTAVFATHGHGDHWFGAAPVLDRFPDARLLAAPEVVAHMRATSPDGQPSPFWDAIMPGRLPATLPTATAATESTVDGARIEAVSVGHSDTDQSTVLHVPELDLVVAGDVIYNRVHQYTAESANGGLDAWLAAVELVAKLNPSAVVAGHKNPARDDDPASIADTRDYLTAAAEVLAGHPDRRGYYQAMVARFPEWLNPPIAWLSAVRLLRD